MHEDNLEDTKNQEDFQTIELSDDESLETVEDVYKKTIENQDIILEQFKDLNLSIEEYLKTNEEIYNTQQNQIQEENETIVEKLESMESTLITGLWMIIFAIVLSHAMKLFFENLLKW